MLTSLLKFSTRSRMATVNYSVPEQVKAEFDRAFGDGNKSAVIAELMRRAVRERTQQARREQLFRQLTERRPVRGTARGGTLRSTRTAART
jgi:hypothetical protein